MLESGRRGWRTALVIALAVGAAAATAASTGTLWLRTTLLDPAHMLEVLEDANAHAYLREQGLPSWLDDRMRAFGVEDLAQREFARRVLQEVVSEEALRERSTLILERLLPYAAGDTEELTIRPRLDEWVLAVPDALARLSFPAWLTDAVLVPKLEPAVAALRREPLSVRLTAEQTRELAREIAPAQWMNGQVVGATYAVARWAVGEQRTFQVRIRYADRVAQATAAFERLMRESGVESVLLERVVVPAAVQGLAQLAPFAEHGADPVEVRRAIERLAPRGWLADQVAGAIDALGAWLAGRVDGFLYTINTGALRDTAASVVGEVARETLGEHVTDEELKELSRTVRAFFPESTTWTDTELRAALGDEAHDQLQWLRATIREGFTYDQDVLRRELRDQMGLTDGQIDTVRGVLGEGFAYTELDLRAGRLGLPLEGAMASVRRLSTWGPVPSGMALALLLALALVSGPGSRGRAQWVLGAIMVAGFLALLVLAPIAAAFVNAHVLDWVPGSADTDAARAFADRLGEALDGTVDRLRWLGGGMALGAGVPLGVVLWRGRRRRVGGQDGAPMV